MFGIIIIYFIAKRFSDLAALHKKNKFAFGLLGVVTYYGASFLLGLILSLISALTGTNFIDNISELSLSLIALPFGLLAVWGLHKYLSVRWSEGTEASTEEALDSDLLN